MKLFVLQMRMEKDDSTVLSVMVMFITPGKWPTSGVCRNLTRNFNFETVKVTKDMSSTVSSNQEDSSEVLHGSPQSIGDDSSDDAVKTKPKCLIVCTGSVATLKVPELVVELSEYFDVMVACTGNSCFFLEKSMTYNPDAWNKFELLGGWNLVLKDEDGEQNIHVYSSTKYIYQ